MIYNSDQIQQIIPHRYPFLLVDQILSIEDQKIVGIKAVSANEMHFLGTFSSEACHAGGIDYGSTGSNRGGPAIIPRGI
jgi:3-hydroxyacyl-[acyl-carrier-protein] dehydratase